MTSPSSPPPPEAMPSRGAVSPGTAADWMPVAHCLAAGESVYVVASRLRIEPRFVWSVADTLTATLGQPPVASAPSPAVTVPTDAPITYPSLIRRHARRRITDPELVAIESVLVLIHGDAIHLDIEALNRVRGDIVAASGISMADGETVLDHAALLMMTLTLGDQAKQPAIPAKPARSARLPQA